MQKILPFLLCFFLFLFFPQAVFAVSLSIINSPATINDESFTLTASISGAATGTNYLRVDIYKEGTTNYFGETYNGSDWYSGSDGKQYLPISVKTGVIWNGSVQARIGSFSNTDYDGSVTYRIRLRRYTSSGGSGSEDASLSSVPVIISVPTATPTSTPDPTSTPKPSKTPTSTEIPTKAPTVKPTIKKVSPSVTKKVTPKPTSAVLGELTSKKKKTPTPSVSAKDGKVFVKGSSVNLLSSIFILSGGVLIVGCGILIFFRRRK